MLGSACTDDIASENPPVEAPKYSASIRRTAHGIPHIVADDLGSLAYGMGYSFARSHVCILADQIIKVRSERARYLGPGPNNFYAGSDFAYLSLGIYERARNTFSSQPQEVQELLKGYVAGYNRFVSDSSAALPEPCRGADWVKPIDEVDLLAYSYSLGLAGSAYQLILAIAAAEPPRVGVGAGKAAPPSPGVVPLDSFQVTRPHTSDVGSNGWAIGADRSETGHGMVVANPHFPWEGELKLWESQLTVPGQLNIYGVGLLGVPAVLIGFNDNVAWTHTFSAGQRMTLYGLQLVPGKPTTYLYNGQEREMVAKDYTILVKLPEGSVTNITRKMYSSHYGPIIVIPGTAEWTTQSALTFRDANLDNTQLLAQFVAMNRARNMQEFQQVYAQVQGIPWVNTMAADRAGNTWYTDATPTPNLTQAAIQRWRAASSGADPTTTAIFRNLGLVLLDGSNPDNEWQTEAGSRSPGLVPFSRSPQLSRRDFVFNANDSHWLSNPSQRLEGFSPLHGLENAQQSMRTRMNALMLTEVRADGASGADGKFSRAELETAILSNRGMPAELLRTAVVQRCQGATTVTYNGAQVDVRPACAVLAAWDNRYDTSSVGAALWREFLGGFPDPNALFAVPFNPANPLTTPHTLAPAPETGTDPVLTALARAVTLLGQVGFNVNQPLGALQHTPRVAGQRIPIHGGTGLDGTANVVGFGTFKSTTPQGEFSATRTGILSTRTGLSREGYVVNNGSSFIMAMEFTATGVNARAVLTYGESSNPESEYFADQTRMFSNKEWRPILFTDEQITSSEDYQQVKVIGD
ncbi:MAG TPA: penicillin acylase family protein [Myxococcus sp.]|nr:penicillin acylase family protein [Myxococcus sp.]